MSGKLERLRSLAAKGPRHIVTEGLRRVGHRTRREVLRAYFSAVMPEGCDLMAEEWDQLIILDGCRLDTFERHNTIEGSLETRISKGAKTAHFLERNFSGASHPDTVYVTANPMHRVDRWCDVDLDRVFQKVVDVWATEWDDELGTVPPETMAAATRRASERFPDHRLIAHFVQPHYPFIGPLGQELDHSGIRGKGIAEQGRIVDDERGIWQALEAGELPVERVRAAYEENLELALPHVEELVDTFDGTTVVTSDHGNHFGEFAKPFPTRLYGHPDDFRTPELVEMPWLIARGDGSDEDDAGRRSSNRIRSRRQPAPE